MTDFNNYKASLLYYKNPGSLWESCYVIWANGELSYYSPLLPRVYPIPPIPFRLANGSNHFWEHYMLDTGIRHVDEIKKLITKYNFDTVKYTKYQVIPATERNVERLEWLLAEQSRMYYSDLKEKIENQQNKITEHEQVIHELGVIKATTKCSSEPFATPGDCDDSYYHLELLR